MALRSQSQENGDSLQLMPGHAPFLDGVVFRWVGLTNSGPLAWLDPAVYPGPVGPLGRGEEKGPTADPVLRSS